MRLPARASPSEILKKLSQSRSLFQVVDHRLKGNACSGDYGRAAQALPISEALDRLMAISGLRARVEDDPARVREVDLPLLRGDARRLPISGSIRTESDINSSIAGHGAATAK